MARERISVGGGVAAAVGLLPRALAGAWLVLALLAASNAVVYFVEAGGAGLETWARPLAKLVAAVLQIVAAGALFRLALSEDGAAARRRGLGLGGMQWTQIEWVLLGAAILMGLLLGVVAIMLALAVAAVGFATGAHQVLKDVDDPVTLWRLIQQDWRAAVVMATGAVAFAVLLLVWARTALFQAATVAEKRMVVTSAFDLTRGSTVPLVVGLILISLPLIAFYAVQDVYVPDLALLEARTGLRLDPAWVSAGSEAFMLDVLQTVLAAGFLAHAYRRVARRETPMELGAL